MANITDAELTILKNSLAFVRDAIKEDDSALAIQIKEKIVESEQIISAKMGEGGEAGGTPEGTSSGSQGLSHGLYGGSVDVSDINKSLFEMFHLDGRLLQRRR